MGERKRETLIGSALTSGKGQTLSTGRFLGSPTPFWEVTLVERVVPRATPSPYKHISFSNLCGSSKPGLKIQCCLFYLSSSDFLFPDEELSSWPSVK